jgi:hypothetical protein
MNANLRRTLIALTVLSAFGASLAYAGEGDGGQGQGNSTSVKISKHVTLNSDINISGNPYVNGSININAAAVALSQSTQSSSNNSVTNDAAVVNGSTINGDVGNKASGNLGVNQAAGDFNGQGNSAAIAAAGSSSEDDSDFAFGCDSGNCGGGDPRNAGGMADAETFANQSLTHANTSNQGTTNNTNISGDAFNGASGNVGVNQASGDNNEQLNALAAATTSNNVYALATSTLDQEWSGNKVANDPYNEWCFFQQNTSNNANLSGDVLSGATGNIGLNQASGTGNLQSNSLSMAVANTK